MDVIVADLSVDTRGQACPMPVLSTKRALAGMAPGQVLEVLATDFGAESDIPVLARRLGHTVLAVLRPAGELRFLIRKG